MRKDFLKTVGLLNEKWNDLLNKIFEVHPFLGPFIILICAGLPWWFAFFPGTLQYDSCGQLLQYLGVSNMTGHHPVGVSLLMGVLLDLGRILFKSDNMAIFLYTGPQFLIQSMIIAYAFCIFKRFNIFSFWQRCICLLYYAIFPIIPNWGISFVKDTGYYICFLLLTLVSMDAFGQNKKVVFWWQKALWILSLIGVCCFRNDGRYVALVMVTGVFIYRPIYRKIALIGGGASVCIIFLIEGIFMPYQGIPSGSVREMLSVPLLQTANYLKHYEEDVTEEEMKILAGVFQTEDLNQIALKYNSEISDEVKEMFLEYPEKKEIVAYFKVWWEQCKKRPIMYIQTYWEHCRGYFDPFVKCYGDVMGWFTILDGNRRTDEYLNVFFNEQNEWLRDQMKLWTWWLYKIFPFSMLFRPGVYTWIMFLCLGRLAIKKRYKNIFIIMPGIAVLMICTLSPLNGSVRYYLPVMAATPIYISSCFLKSAYEVSE